MPIPSKNLKADRKLTKQLAEQEFAQNLIGDVKDIVKEVIRASNSNPLIGILTSIVAIDVLYRAKIISLTAVQAMYVALGVVEGGSVIAEIGDLIPSLGGKAPPETTPSATTLVYADSGETGDSKIDALLERIGKK